ncbi:MAG TPA: hypothetical protein VFQ63_01765 [Patescibacteria group bacterium]|nr:hypothetical protein [Patescibacteria group bacterium]
MALVTEFGIGTVSLPFFKKEVKTPLNIGRQRTPEGQEFEAIIIPLIGGMIEIIRQFTDFEERALATGFELNQRGGIPIGFLGLRRLNFYPDLAPATRSAKN